MKDAGSAQEKHTYAPWTDRLRNQLDREHEKRYDDVYKGMEKAGAKGSMATDWVEEDMVRAGNAGSMLDRLKSSISDVTYKLEGWQKDRYDVDKVKENEARPSVGGKLSSFVVPCSRKSKPLTMRSTLSSGAEKRSRKPI